MALRPKTLGAIIGAGIAGYGSWHAYTYTREVVMNNLQRDEADAWTVRKIEDAYKTLQANPECNSLLKKHLTKDVLDKLKYKKTKLGATLYDVIKPGVNNQNTNVGIYAPDKESYHTFAPLFDPIIEEYHGVKIGDHKATTAADESTDELKPLDPNNKFIKSTRIHCYRAIDKFPFHPLLSADDYLVMQEKLQRALATLDGEGIKGEYRSLEKLGDDAKKDLAASGASFDEDKKSLRDSAAFNEWPKGRGVFSSADRSLIVFINEHEHLRIISAQAGSNLSSALQRFRRGLKALEAKVPFARDARLGYLTYSPANLGSAVQASVQLNLPKLSARKDFKQVCEKLNLQVSGSGSTVDVSNRPSFGTTDSQAVRQVYDGVKKLIEMEQAAK